MALDSGTEWYSVVETRNSRPVLPDTPRTLDSLRSASSRYQRPHGCKSAVHFVLVITSSRSLHQRFRHPFRISEHREFFFVPGFPPQPGEQFVLIVKAAIQQSELVSLL